MSLSAELEIPTPVVHPGDRLPYRVVNTGTEAIVFGEPYGLERLTRTEAVGRRSSSTRSSTCSPRTGSGSAA